MVPQPGPDARHGRGLIAKLGEPQQDIDWGRHSGTQHLGWQHSKNVVGDHHVKTPQLNGPKQLQTADCHLQGNDVVPGATGMRCHLGWQLQRQRNG